MFNEDVLFQISLKQLAFLCCGLPLTGFALCVLFAVLLHFEGSTRTHCGVANYLPSISAAIGDYVPERYIWRFCIALHCFPRFIAALSYRNFYLSSPLRPLHSTESGYYNLLCSFICLLHLIENLALLTLTFISSTENHDVHEISFVVFVVSSLLYMLLTLYMFDHSGRRRSFSKGEKSFQYKLVFFTLNIFAFVLSLYFFLRHNRYCEAGIYTFFAGCEYVVVITNILFHGTIALDFYDKRLLIAAASPLEWKAT